MIDNAEDAAVEVRNHEERVRAKPDALGFDDDLVGGPAP